MVFALSVAAAITAVLRATIAGFITVACAISTYRSSTAIATSKRFDLSHAHTIPGCIAAVWVLGTNTGLDVLVIAPGIVVSCAAISVAGTTIVGFRSANTVPFRLATERVVCADTILNVGVLAADGIIGYAA